MRVLLVDDEQDIRRIGQLSLEGVGGWQASLASSGQEAVEAARQHRPDLILLDMMMPGMDGMATLARLRAEPDLASIPVVFVTAKVQRAEVERYLQAGAVGVIRKPFDPMTLPGEIRAILAKLGITA